MSSDFDQHVMIEYHDIECIKIILYKEYIGKKKEIINLLSELLTTEDNKNLSQCIAINSDIEQYCVPILIAGIIESNKFSFTFKLNETSFKICNKLTINLMFSNTILLDYKSVFKLNICGQPIYLLMHKYLQVKYKYSIEYSKSSPLKFYYVIATSGTTGIPKIVRVTDNSINSNISDFSHLLNISSADKILQLTPLTFDPSIIEIFLSIKNNCTLLMVSDIIKKKADLLLDKIVYGNVTVLQTTPSLLLGKWSKEKVKKCLLTNDTSLRVLLLGGEPFLKLDIISQIREKENATRLFNVYGVTEVSCWASMQEVISENIVDEVDYIGEPLSETILQVRNNDGVVIREGEGVLYIGSSTRICVIDDEPVIPNNFPLYRNTEDIVEIKNEKIYYQGRVDATIKRFGNKVNLHKLENHIERSNMIEKCASIWDKNNHKLYIFVKPSSIFYDVSNLKSELRKHIGHLTDIYQPDEIHFLNNFPLTEHNKICKSTLQNISKQREKPVEHFKDILQNLWMEHLGVCTNEGFLSLGGNSITVLQMSNILSDLLNTDLSELTTIWLNNGNFNDSLAFLSELYNINYLETSNMKHTENQAVKEDKVQDTNANDSSKEQKQMLEVQRNADMKCLWQKGRGDNCSHLNPLEIKKIEIGKNYDLKKCVDASPTVFKYSSGTTFVTVGSHSGIICTVSLDDINSKECYHVQLPDRIVASVLILDNFLGVIGCYDGFVYCLHLLTGDIAWKFQTGNMVKCTALGCHSNKCIFVGSYDTYMYCLSMENGQQIWRTKVSSGSITAKPQFDADKKLLLVVTLDGTCAALDAKSGNIQWKRKLSHPIFSSPAVLQNRCVIFCTVIGNVTCFDIDHDLELWTYSTKLSIFSCPIIHYDPATESKNICIVAQDTFFRLECDEINTHNPPTLRYKRKLQNTTLCTPWCEGNDVILADSGGTVYVLNFHDGVTLTEINLRGEIFSSPILCENNIVIGCRDNYLYILRTLRS